MIGIDYNFFKAPHTKDNLIFNTGKSSDITQNLSTTLALAFR